MRPFPEQGPMFAVRVMLAVIVWPHYAVPFGFATAGAGRMTRVELRIVKRSMMASGTFEDSLSLKTGSLVQGLIIYGLGGSDFPSRASCSDDQNGPDETIEAGASNLDWATRISNESTTASCELTHS